MLANFRVRTGGLLALALALSPALAEAGLPKIPSDTAFVAVIADPAGTFERAEAMAGRVGLAPPEAKPGWIRSHPALAWTEGHIDRSRPVYLALTAMKKGKRGPAEPEMLAYIPLAKKANVEMIVARIAPEGRKLASRREGDYLIITEKRARLSKRARKRALPKDLLTRAKQLDVAVFIDSNAFDRETLEAVLDEQAGKPRTMEDRLAAAAIEVMVELSREATPKGEFSMIGGKFAKDGLRLVTRSPLVKGSLLGGWALSTPTGTSPRLTGHAPGPMLGGLGTSWDAETTVNAVRTVYGKVKAKLSKVDKKELALVDSLGPALEKGFRSHPALSVVVRPGRGEMPQIVVVGPKLDAALLAKIPDLVRAKADPKAKVPAHARLQIDPEANAYIVDAGARSIVAVGVGRLDLADLVKAAEAGTAPVAGDKRYRTARAALPDRLALEAYLDPGPLAKLLLQEPEAAPFRPLAQLVGTLPPVALGVSLDGAAVQSDVFVSDGLIGLAGMAFSLAAAASAGSAPR